MAFHLKDNESISEGITRNVRRQIEKALKHLGDPSIATQEDGPSPKLDVGEVRRCFKRVRAALRLVRDELGDDRYHAENYCLRDAARPLTRIRDAEILVETADELRQQFPRALGPRSFSRIHQALVANQHAVSRRLLEEERVCATVAGIATSALTRFAAWKLERDGWAALEPGVRRVYRTARRALAAAVERSSVARLHELRKQSKYLWHQLQLLEPRLTGADKELDPKLHQLSTLLGDDHDLAVLRETLAADPLNYGGHRALKGVFALIDRRREDLERQAFALGRELYRDPPGVFSTRIKASLHYEDSKEACPGA
jgi:CHAD domain-containing protein